VQQQSFIVINIVPYYFHKFTDIMATTTLPLLTIVLAMYSIVDVNAWTTRSDINSNNDSSSRRSFLQNKLMTAGSIMIGGLTLLPTSSNIGHAQDLLDEEIEVYFGCGCFCK
jgi:xanthine/uracil permease